jgi:acyl-CoA synthetase (AMP-forming)/AMP-acid ligase II
VAEVLEYSLATIWEGIADRFGDRDALVHGSNTLTWAQFDDHADRLANAFVNAGEGWGSGYGGVVDVLVLLALISAVVAFFGHAAYASTILGTIVKGPARAQEVLVSVEVDA